VERVYSTRVSVTDSVSRYETTPSPYLTETQLRGYLWQNEWRWARTAQCRAGAPRRPTWKTTPSTARRRSQDALALGYGYNAGAHTLQLNVRHDDDSEFGGKGTGSAAYGYAFAPSWRATASVGTAFRAPTLYQRFSQYGVPRCSPETSRNAELGVRYAQGSSSFSATAYRNRVSNLISVRRGRGCAPFGCYANTARAEYEGVTLAARTAWGAAARLARFAEPARPRHRQAAGAPRQAPRHPRGRYARGGLDAGRRGAGLGPPL
jgi:vitamin B12 transporter